MKIGVIGVGNIGSTIAQKLAAAGHSIKLAGSKSPDDIRDKAAEIGAVAVTARDAAKDVDVIMIEKDGQTVTKYPLEIRKY